MGLRAKQLLFIFKNNAMHLKKTTPVIAIAIGLVLALATSAFKQAPKNKSNDTIYYFRFDGTNGQEDQEAEWTAISQSVYDLSACNKSLRGCMLATTSITGSGSNLHPAQVDVDTDPNNPANKSPKTGDGVIEVKNRVNSY
jgi:hypothetical protein